MLLENDIAAVSVLVDDPLALYGYLTEAMLVLNKHEECAASSSRPPRQSAERAPLVCVVEIGKRWPPKETCLSRYAVFHSSIQ